MADMLALGLAHLAAQLKANASQTVTYQRGTDSVVVQATFGMKLLKLDRGDGNVVLEWTDMDFVITAADLIINAEVITPDRGDQVLVTYGDDIEAFEVVPMGSEAPWRYCDPHRLMVRIHAKHIETEPYS